MDANWHGQPRKLLLQANRHGFFYVLDRTNGELLLAPARSPPSKSGPGFPTGQYRVRLSIVGSSHPGIARTVINIFAAPCFRTGFAGLGHGPESPDLFARVLVVAGHRARSHFAPGNANLNVAPVSLDGDLTLLAVQEDLTGQSGSVAAQHQDPINQLDVLAAP